MAGRVNTTESTQGALSENLASGVQPSVPKVEVDEVTPPSETKTETAPVQAEAPEPQAAPQPQQQTPARQTVDPLQGVLDMAGKPPAQKPASDSQKPQQSNVQTYVNTNNQPDIFDRFKPKVSPSVTSIAARTLAPEEVEDITIGNPDDIDNDMTVPATISSRPISSGTSVHSERGIRALKDKYEAEQKKIKEEEAKNKKESEEAASEENVADTNQSALTTSAPIPRPRVEPVVNEIPRWSVREDQKDEEAAANTKVKNRIFGGVAITDKLGGSRKLKMREVSIGSDIVEELLRIPNSGFLKRIEDETKIKFDRNSPTFVDDVINAINLSSIKVATSKSPVNVLSSYQGRILCVHAGRGVKIHPIMSKLYNADFDGDEMTVSFSRRYAFKAVDPMKTLFDQKGELLIDPDFFPWATLVGNLPWETGESYEQYFYDNVFYRRNKEERKYLSKLIGEYCGEHKDADAKKEALKNYIKGIYKVASNHRSRDAIVDDMLTDTYNALRYLSLVQAQLMPEATVTLYDNMPKPVTTADRAILKVTEDLVSGVVPMNFQAVKEKLTAYVGEGGDNKNLAFRFTANICKMFRIDHTLVVGNDEGFEEIFDKLMQYAYSKKISNAEFSAAKAAAAGATIREAVISKVGFPCSERYRANGETPEQAFRNFIKAFVQEYQRQAAAINLANKRIYSDFEIEFSGEDIVVSLDGSTIGDMVTPFINIYGDYSMSSLFGDMVKLRKNQFSYKKGEKNKDKVATFHVLKMINDSYMDTTLRDFSKHNKLQMGSQVRYNKKKLNAIGDKNLGDIEALLYAIADSRTSSASAFSRSVYGGDRKGDDNEPSMCDKLFEVIGYLKKVLDECNEVGNLTPLMQETDSVIGVLRAFGGDLFSFYNMSNMKGFLESAYGKALVNAKNAAQIGGIRISMLVNRRIDRINQEVEKRNKLIESDAPTWRIAAADNAVQAEIATLASSSPTWAAIMKELTCSPMDRAWDNIVADLSKSENDRKLKILHGDSAKTKVHYWQNPKHSNILDFLLDTSLGFTTKECVLADIVRWRENFSWIESYEVTAQLEEDSSPAFSEFGPDGRSIFDVKRDFEGRYSRWKKRDRFDMREEVKQARKAFKSGDLLSHLRYLADNPEEHVDMPDEIYHDALLSSLSKQYKQSEKGSTHTALNSFFMALSYVLRGGVASDVYRTDDRILGMKASENLTIQDVVSLLAYPDKKLKVYDKYGQIAILSRDTLCGEKNADENNVWDYLIANPNIAAACRTHRTNVNNFSVKGGAYLSNTRTFSDSIIYSQKQDSLSVHSAKKKALTILRDDPTFGGLVMALTPTKDRATRQIRADIKRAEDLALELVCGCAFEYRDTGDVTFFSLTNNVRNATWSPVRDAAINETIVDKSGNERTELEFEVEGVYQYDADDFDHIVNEAFKRFAEKLLKKDSNGVSALDLIEASDYAVDIMQDNTFARFQVKDRQAFSNFFDVRQELNGAKTSVSTGVEGTTTYMLYPWVALLQTRDRYASLNELDPDTYEQLKGCQTNVREVEGGPFLKIGDVSPTLGEITIDVLLDLDANAVVEVPDGFIVPDKTSDPRPNRQLSSIVSWLMTKRDDGAEAHNLKIKKYGTDKLNSVTKYDMYIDASSLPNEILRAYNDGGYIQALNYLGKVLKDANEELEYDDMTIANFMCLADIMLLRAEDGSLVLDENGMPIVRSIEQLSTAIKYRMPYELVENGNMEQIAEAAKEIANTVGTVKMINPNEATTEIRTSAKSWFHPVINREASSFERNLATLQSLIDTENARAQKDPNIKPVKPWGPKTLNDKSFKMLSSLKKHITHSEAKFYGSYKPIGVAGSTIYHRVPGMNAMVLIDKLVVDGKPLTKEIVHDVCAQAFRMGNTAWISPEVHASGLIPENLLKELIPYGNSSFENRYEDGFIIPFFDMRLNGYYENNGTGRFSVFQAPADRIVILYADELNEYSLGDSGIQPFKALTDRLGMIKSGCWEIPIKALFGVTYSAYPGANFSKVRLASEATIRKYIVNGFPEAFDIDYGMDPSMGERFKNRKGRIDEAIRKYRENYIYTDPDTGILRDSISAGDIIGWAELEVRVKGSSVPRKVLAPIMPFAMHESRNAPITYDVIPSSVKSTKDENITYDPKDITFSHDGYDSVGSLSVNWMLNADLNGQYVKIFEGQGAANKYMMWIDPVDGLTLEEGTQLDGCYSAETTKSRKGGTDLRIKSMETMMFFARKRGYNFANAAESFPDDKELKEALSHERLSREFWMQPLVDGGQPRIKLYLTGELKFCSDKEMNEFLVHEIKKFWDNGGTPSDYLASSFFNQEEGRTYYSNIWWEFPAMFEQSTEYQRRFLRFHHMMDEDLCPDGFDNVKGDELFLPDTSANVNSFDFGVLKMKIPRRSVTNPNEIYWLRGEVSAGWSFFGEDFSAIRRPSVNGSQVTMELLNLMLLTGRVPQGYEYRNLLKWAWSDLDAVQESAYVEGEFAEDPLAGGSEDMAEEE